MEKCEHKDELHFASEGTCSAGDIFWCPDCGAISVTSQWDDGYTEQYRNWRLPNGRIP
jgi:hypothetical protein